MAPAPKFKCRAPLVGDDGEIGPPCGSEAFELVCFSDGIHLRCMHCDEEWEIAKAMDYLNATAAEKED